MNSARQRPAYVYRHVIGFQETNVVGNVYYVNHVAWQGRCREIFLREHAPDVLAAIAGDLRLVTLRCACEYLDELVAFDEVEIRMRLERMVQNRLALSFEYLRLGEGRDPALVARGSQELACMRSTATGLVATEVPPSLAAALRQYETD